MYSKVRSEVYGPVTRQNKTVLFLGNTMQIDIQAKKFLLKHWYLSSILQCHRKEHRNLQDLLLYIINFNSSAYSVQMLAHICHI